MAGVTVNCIDHLRSGKVQLSDGTELESDALLANTGWKYAPSMKFLADPRDPVYDLLEQADSDILNRLPRLQNQPVWNKNYVSLTNQKGISSNDDVTTCAPLTRFMLHHFIVRPSERFLRARDVAFVGMVRKFSNIITAHHQGLWVSWD